MSTKVFFEKTESLHAFVQIGSYGHSPAHDDVDPLVYWHSILSHPWAPYHLTFLGVCKDFVRYFCIRLSDQSNSPSNDNAHDAQTNLSSESLLSLGIPKKRRKNVKDVLQARIRQCVMRSKPDCQLVDFLEHLNPLGISEMQLIFEVGLPYLLHDISVFGVPDELVILW